MVFMYIHCFLPLLLVSVIKCYVFNCIVLCLVLFPCFTYMCLLQLPIYVHASTLYPMLAHHHLSYIDVYCVQYDTVKQLCYVHFLCLLFFAL